VYVVQLDETRSDGLSTGDTGSPEGLEAGNYLFFAVLFTPLLILALRTFLTGGWPAARQGEVSAA
jgi:hypothetical protein